jgi:hypothetical protein
MCFAPSFALSPENHSITHRHHPHGFLNELFPLPLEFCVLTIGMQNLHFIQAESDHFFQDCRELDTRKTL